MPSLVRPNQNHSVGDRNSYSRIPFRKDTVSSGLSGTESGPGRSFGNGGGNSSEAGFMASNQGGFGGGSGGGKTMPSRPPTPSGLNENFAYSTLLRRTSVDETHFSSPIPNANRFTPSSNTHHPHNRQNSANTNPFSHTTKTSTPSGHYSTLSVPETIHQLSTSPTLGLSSHVIQALLELHGANEFQVGSKEEAWKKFLKQFWESPLILLLLGSALVSALVGNLDDAVSIALAIIIVVTVGFVQEQRSEKSLEALNKLVPHYCHLIRDGKPSTVLANVLVPGDLITVSTGDRIPADVRLVAANDLEIDESTLTGETTPARKHTEPIRWDGGGVGKDGSVGGGSGSGDPEISERSNTAFMGTLVRNGNGVGIVVGTGGQTEFGVVFSMMQEVEERKTPLQIKMDELAQKLSVISFGVIGMICLIGVIQKRSWLEMFTIGVSLAVAAIPEGLPIVVTVTLALGVLRMSKRKAIVKKLPSVETLGSVSVICSDKTGTLTTNQMTVTKAFTVDEGIIDLSTPPPAHISQALERTLLIGNFCNQAFRNADGANVGRATEVALLNALQFVGLTDQRPNFQRTSEIPFNSEQKWQSVTGNFLNPTSDRDTTYVSGAIDSILPKCRFYLRADGSTAGLENSTRSSITLKSEELAQSGLRIVGFAFGPDHDNLIFAGAQAMLDPPRKGVANAISSLNLAGIQVVMITGDSEHTATSIAKQLGIRMNPGSAGVLTGRDIDLLSKRQLMEKIGGVTVFARTTPRHKMAIVEAFQARGAVVAMTGDGVNDAPALKLADIGLAMGKGGTDVAKEAADVILVDDNFATILPAVEEGKSIFYNVQNFLSFQLSTAVAALSLITLSTALQLPNPLNPMQILFINILMDGPPSQSLGVDPVNREVMRRPPRLKNAPVITQRLLLRILFSASLIVLGTLFIYAHELSDGRVSTRDQTMTFTSFVFLDLASAIQNRGLSCGFTQNRMLLTTVSISFLVQILLIYFPPFQAIFQTTALSFRDLSVLLALGGVSMTLHEIRRRWEKKTTDSNRWEDQIV